MKIPAPYITITAPYITITAPCIKCILGTMIAFLLFCQPVSAQEAASARQDTVSARQEAVTDPPLDEDYKQLVRRGVTALEDDSLRMAETLFKQALKKEPAAHGNALIWGYLAGIFERTGREHDALEAYDIALGLSPRTIGLLLSRASLYMKLGNERRALTDYNDVLDLNEDHPEALLMRAFIKQQQRLLKDARADYEHLLKVNAVHEQALLGLAILNDADRRPQEAMETINRVILLYPTHAAGYALRAGFEADRRQYELAEADYTEAIRLAPEDPHYLLARARLYTQIKKKRLAREDARKAGQLGASVEEIAGALDMKR